ncbi:MAG: bacteriohopanetetrol glucosamine biosynthesis glycosyltransferase HpnI [Acidobacteriota bacterium]|nr:bacteriohopanetetrol glucosamine biosynthesis glycosyltransferase HpnI [Acidobacteriota bacterium]
MNILRGVLADHGPLFWVQAGLVVLCVIANVYSVLCVVAASQFFRLRPKLDPDFHPPISILKPLRGLDPDAYANLSSFFRLKYPRYELIFALESEFDAAVPLVRRILEEFPDVDARIVFHPVPIEGSPKVAGLASAARASRYKLLLVSDGDIRVGPDHLSRMVQPMADPIVGVVTCLYRSHGNGWSGTLDAIGLSAEFQRDALVARKVEGVSFAMGSGILIRAAVLEAIGGFDALANHLADDFLLGNLPTRRGYRTEFAHEVVDHSLGTRRFVDLVRHQLRWNRGIRASRPGGYAGMVFTHATALGVLLLAAEKGSLVGWMILAGTVAISMFAAWFVAVLHLKDQGVRRFLWLVPVRDVLSFVFWIAGMFGSTVHWRGRRFRLGRDGLLTPVRAAAARRASVRPASSRARRAASR